MFESKVL